MLYLAAGTAGVLIHPLVASVIFLLLPAFYGLTSHGFDQRPAFLGGGDNEDSRRSDGSARGD